VDQAEGASVNVASSPLSPSSGTASSAGPSGRIAKPGLTVFLPVHNEAETIREVLDVVYREVVVPTGAELLVCEDGSTDGTDEVLRELAKTYPMRLLAGGSRKGYADAVREGLERIRTPLTFFADSDGQYDPRDFWRLWPHAAEYDIVVGHKVVRDEPFHRILLSRGFHVLAKMTTEVPLKDMDCGFRLVRREVVEEVLPEATTLRYSFWAEFTMIAYRKGFRILEVPITHRQRPRGTTSMYPIDRLPAIMGHQFVGLLALARRLRNPPRKP
jgi:glycosyltransferase involved in cell wall biosynthesis